MEKLSTGYKQSPLDDRDLYFADVRDQILAGEKEVNDYSRMTYEEQGDTSTCVSQAVTKACEWLYEQKTGKKVQFSRGAHYVQGNVLSGDPDDARAGLAIKTGLRSANHNGLIREELVPFGKPWDVREDAHQKYARWKLELQTTDTSEAVKFKYFRVSYWKIDEMMDVLNFQCPIIIAVDTYRGWSDAKSAPKKPTPNHATLLVGQEHRETFNVLDSLRYKENDDGKRIVHHSNIHEAWGVALDLDLAVAQTAKEAQHIGVLNRYGKLKDSKAESLANALLTEGIGRFGSQKMWEIYTKDKQVYVNAVAYGDYNVSYFKLGKWMSGDIMNQIYAIGTGQVPPFNLDKLRHNQ